MIGTLDAIWRFPVKSMRGEKLDASTLRGTGLFGDRQYAFLRSNDRTRFPWLTGRQLPDLIRWVARYDAPNPHVAKLTVEAPDGKVYAIDDAALLARLSEEAGEPVALLQLGRGAYDSMAVSLVGNDIGDRVAALHGAPVDRRRFRINLEVSLHGDNETAWVGKHLAIGEQARVAVVEPIDRCVMITLDPDTAEKDPTVLRTVSQKLGNQIGVYAHILTRGELRIGDEIRAV
ncbi:MOSC domain-containing protein [Roseiterribacter gracilis]|uniref:MOSC domain-containing protein n=1 Tax=Roseiterribacter gracilis TaxID=2812848 RepID=A0A8S8X8V4_9PROT|nr:hypothetical protein TMPK1_05380 [Rhodospirillales bacterium TMPK1]